MSSRLSSMLVQQGLLAVSDLQDALALQVVRGGTLGTVLLERDLIDEGKLLAVLADITGHPPIEPGMLDQVDPSLAADLAEATGRKLGICPLFREDDRLVVVSSEATDKIALPELAYELNCVIVPTAATELRVNQAWSMVYDVPLPPRFAALCEKYGPRPPRVPWTPNTRPSDPSDAPTEVAQDTPAGEPPPATADGAPEEPTPEETNAALAPAAGTITVHEDESGSPEEPAGAGPAKPSGNGERRRYLKTDQHPFVVDGEHGLPADAPPVPADTGEFPQVEEPVEPEGLAEHAPPPVGDTPAEGDAPVGHDAPADNDAPVDRDAPVAPQGPVAPAASTASGDSGAPLSPEDAKDVLANVGDREQVLLTLARAAHHFLEAVQLYVLRGNKLVGRYSIDGGSLETSEIRQQTIALDTPTIVSRAAQEGGVYIGPVPDSDDSATTLASIGLQLHHVALIPIRLRERTVCVLLGHKHGRSIASTLRVPLARLSADTAEALARAIMRGKADPPPPAQPQPIAVADLPRPPRIKARRRTSSRGLEPVSAAPTTPEPQPTGTMTEREAAPSPPGSDEKVIVDLDVSMASRSIDSLVAGLDDTPEATEDILAELGQRERSSMDWMLDHFPGELRFDRATVAELPPVGQCSAVLQALLIIGRSVVPRLAPLLVQGEERSRFFATYLLSELIFPESLSLLAKRLRDRSPSVRRIAIYGLRRSRDLEHFPSILEALRADLTHPDMRPQRAAMEALAALGDIVATPSLIALLNDNRDDVSATAHRSLIWLTKQDLGTKPQAWLDWWNQNRHRSRVEWLIDGLVHPAAEIRENAAIELGELCDADIPYDPHGAAPEQHEARRQYQQWWTETGLYDFGRLA